MNNNILIQIPDIHIGNEISSYLKDRGVSKAKLARGLGMDSAYLGRLLSKKSLETKTLISICNALNHNFFILWCPDIQSNDLISAPVEAPDCIGKIIDLRLREIKMSQIDFASRGGIPRSDYARVTKKTTFDTDKLAQISRILGKNLFNEYFLNKKQVIDNELDGESLLIKRYENLVIENSRLKQELTDARMEIARLRYTI